MQVSNHIRISKQLAACKQAISKHKQAVDGRKNIIVTYVSNIALKKKKNKKKNK
jgi:hypothetical protein